MRGLDKNKIYSLEELTSEERKILVDNEISISKNGFGNYADLNNDSYKYLVFGSNGDWWSLRKEVDKNLSIVNAKELFYTLENVQVDCRELSEEQVKEMADVFEANGYINSIGLNVCDTYFLLRQRWNKEDRNFGVLGDHKDGRFTTITYEKFMELFNEKDKRNGWYTYGNKGRGNWLMYHDFNKNKIYGFCEYDGTWFENSYELRLDGDSILAPKEEVEKRLIKEAEKRGFKGSFEYDPVYNELWCEKTSIFRDGTWGEPVSEALKPLFEGVALLDEVKSLCGEGPLFKFFQMAGRGENKNCYYFHHSEKHGPNFYTKEDVPYHDGEDWKEDLVVYTQLGSGKKFVTTKERFKKFKEVWV